MEPAKNFITEMIDEHIASGKWGEPGDSSVVHTRFPPEPNGYLHIGHAKSICLNFSLAQSYGGACNLRFDDTNPVKEEDEYVRSIVQDIRWLGFVWNKGCPDDPMAGVLFASDYFQQLHDWAVELIEKGHAYVDDQTPDEIRAARGTLTEPGTPSPYRDRTAAENLDLFEKMVKGEFADGTRVLRAKIDMASSNMNLRDPVMYRVLHAEHHRTGDAWCVYPMYDWAHGLEDSIEGITNSLCTLEFENHRPLYDWFIDAINQGRGSGSQWGEPIHQPQQTEFARLSLTYSVMSKRKLIQLVDEGHVDGWDDPRMTTISGLRRRGYTPEAIRAFSIDVGVTKFNAMIDMARLENACRDHLNKVAHRRMAVLNPLKVTITNWSEGGDESRTEWMKAVNNPEDEGAGKRRVPFTRELFIECDDFMEDAPRKFFRLKPGGEVRLRYAYWITCNEVVRDDAGEVIELLCTYDPQTRGGNAPPPPPATVDNPEPKARKVKGTIHWVSAEHGIEASVKLFDRLFVNERPDRKPKKAGPDWSFLQNINPDSLSVIDDAILEPAFAGVGETECQAAAAGDRFQFERLGYFCVDADSPSGDTGKLMFNRTVSLRDSWAKKSGS